MVYKCGLTSCQTTQYLRTKEIRKYPEHLKTLWNYSLMPSVPLKMKILSILVENY